MLLQVLLQVYVAYAPRSLVLLQVLLQVYVAGVAQGSLHLYVLQVTGRFEERDSPRNRRSMRSTCCLQAPPAVIY